MYGNRQATVYSSIGGDNHQLVRAHNKFTRYMNHFSRDLTVTDEGKCKKTYKCHDAMQTHPSQIFLTLVLSWSPWKKMIKTLFCISSP